MTTLWTTDKLVSHDFPTPSYLVDPVIPQGGIAVLHGNPNVGKTQNLLTLAAAINAGEPFLDRWETRKGAVIFIQADMTGQITQERLRMAIATSTLSSTHWVVEEDGSAPFINIETMTLTKKLLVEAMRDLDPVALFWDTLRKIHLLKENESETPIRVYQSARKICPLATHIFNHHNRKESRDPDANDLPEQDFMGNVQWWGSSGRRS